MAADKTFVETFEEFKNSFSYGSRTDLNFKFLAGLSDADTARFIQELLWKLGDTIDDGDIGRLIKHVIEGQVQGYSGRGGSVYDSGQFRCLEKPVSEIILGLLTATGHFVDGDDPEPFGVKNMTQEEAIERIDDFIRNEPTLSEIPLNTPIEKLRTRHGGYDVRGTQRDPNVAFPIERLVELKQDGLVGELAENAYSFVGACAQKSLENRVAPLWAQDLKQKGIDAVLLVPV